MTPAKTSAQRALTACVFGFGLLLSAFIPEKISLAVPAGVLVGLGLPAAARWVWGERTRPKVNGFWLLVGPGALVLAAFVGGMGLSSGIYLYLPLCLLVGFFLVHDLPMTPTLMVTSGVIGTIVRLEPEFEWTLVPEGKVWWVALATLTCLIAALLERDRLSQRQGVVTPWQWAAVRASFLTLWTVLAVLLRKSLQAGNLFQALGIEVASSGGRLMLLAILAASLILAAVALRVRRPRAPPVPVAPPPPATSK